MTPHFAPKMHLPMSVSLLPLQGPFDNRDSLNLPQVTGCEGTGSEDILGTFILDGWGSKGVLEVCLGPRGSVGCLAVLQP